MTVEKSARRILDYIRSFFIVTGIVFIVCLMIDFELKFLRAGERLPIWIEVPFIFSAFLVDVFFLDVLFMGWARVRFDMFVYSGMVRKNGAKYERGVYVRMETEEYFIPVGQELVLRNSATGNTQVLAGPDSQNAK